MNDYIEYIRMYLIPITISILYLSVSIIRVHFKKEVPKIITISMAILSSVLLLRPFFSDFDDFMWYYTSNRIGSLYEETHVRISGEILFYSVFISNIINYSFSGLKLLKRIIHKFTCFKNGVLIKKRSPLYIGQLQSLVDEHDKNKSPMELMKSLENANTLIFGMPGSGKTFGVITPMIFNSIENGDFTIIIQPKSNIEFRDMVYGCCKKYGRLDDFIYISTSDAHRSSGYNPLGFGTDQEKRDKIMASTMWENSHYEKLAEAKLLDVIQTKGVQRFSELDKLIPNTEDFTGLLADINNYNKSELGHIFNRPNASNILDFYKSKKILYVALDVNSAPVSSRIFGKILLNDIRALVNYIYINIPAKKRMRSSIYIDEFVSFITSGYIDLINKIRETNMRVVMATQSPDDLYINKINIRKALFDNCKNIITFCLQDPDTCDTVSKTFGTIDEVKETVQVQKGLFGSSATGLGSARDIQSMVVNGNDIRELKVLECFVRTNMPQMRYGLKCDWFEYTKIEMIPFFEDDYSDHIGTVDKAPICDIGKIEAFPQNDLSLTKEQRPAKSNRSKNKKTDHIDTHLFAISKKRKEERTTALTH